MACAIGAQPAPCLGWRGGECGGRGAGGGNPARSCTAPHQGGGLDTAAHGPGNDVLTGFAGRAQAGGAVYRDCYRAEGAGCAGGTPAGAKPFPVA